MEFIKFLFDFLLHIDKHLADIISNYGTTTYVILFAIIFIETGLVVWPFLPGDSLLFVVGSFAAVGTLNIWILIPLLFIAAVLGDTVNYYIGKSMGLKILQWKVNNRPLVKQEYIDQTHAFYEKHGSKTIIMARFVPIVRTFAPFVAGIGEMNYAKFISYNIIGGAIWIVALSLLGYFFGQIPVIKNNFEKVILGIIFVSVLPIVWQMLKPKFATK
jgi:membrane-associated protein